ncbi:unnamed protein product [Closterium sp. Naga37s-1]|nr:unnamed protein product [Closterium sp. Naga37s-1]
MRHHPGNPPALYLPPPPAVHSTALSIAATKLYRLQQPPVPAIADSPTSMLVGREGREGGDSQAVRGLRCEKSSVGRLRQLESTELCGLLLLGDGPGPSNAAMREQRRVHENKHGRGGLEGSSTRATVEDVNNGEAERKQTKEEEAQVTSKQLEMLQQANDEVSAVVVEWMGMGEVDGKTDGQKDGQKEWVKRAIADYSRVIDLDPSNAEALRWRGILSFNLKDYHAAEKDFQEAIHLDPSQSFVFRGLALAIGDSGRWRESLAVFAEGVRRHPQDADLWHSKGRAHKEVGEVDQAIEALQRALQIRKAVATYQELVAVSRLVGDYRAAIRYAREGLQLDRGDMELAHAHASSLHALGDLAEAMRKYQAALALQPRDQDGQREVLSYTVARLQQPLSSIQFDWDFTLTYFHPPLLHSRLISPSPTVAQEAWTNSDPIATLPGYQPLSLRMAGLAALDVMQQVRLFRFLSTHVLLSSAPIHFDGVQATRKSPGLAALDEMQLARASWDAMAQELQGRESAAGNTFTDTTTTKEKDALAGGGGRVESTAKQRQKASENSGKDSGKSRSRSKVSGGGVLKGWRDVYEMITRWRQIADPTAAILWNDQLKSFEAMREALLESERAFSNDQPFAVPHNSRHMVSGVCLFLATCMATWGEWAASAMAATVITRAADLQVLHQPVGKDFLVQAPCYSHVFPGCAFPATAMPFQGAPSLLQPCLPSIRLS